MDVASSDLVADVIYQIGALQGMAASAGARVRYVKPHGALYNTIAHDRRQGMAVINAIKDYNASLPLVVLAGSPLAQLAREQGLQVVAEAFADRAYNDDGSLEGYSYPPRPAHIFINPKIIAEAPAEYFWAGVGDALSKQPEVEYATSAGNLEHTAGLGLALAHTCSEPLFTYGVQGLEDVRQDLSSEAVKQIALDIVVNTGYVSNLTNQNDYYYNSSVAHAFYNATCSIPREGTYLHGEVVSLGVLVLFAYTGDTENLERYAAFNKQMGLPVTLEQVGLTEADIPALCEYAHATNEWKQGNPEPFTDEKFAAAIKAANAYGHTL